MATPLLGSLKDLTWDGFIGSGWCNKVPQMGRLKQQKFSYLQFWRPKTRQGWCQAKAVFLTCQQPPSCCALPGGELPTISPQKNTNAFWSGPTHTTSLNPAYLPQVHPPGRVWLQHMDLQRIIQSIAWGLCQIWAKVSASNPTRGRK